MSRGILPCQPGQDDSSRATTAVELHRADIALRLLEFMVEAIGLILDQHTRSAQVSVGNVVQCEMERVSSWTEAEPGQCQQSVITESRARQTMSSTC